MPRLDSLSVRADATQTESLHSQGNYPAPTIASTVTGSPQLDYDLAIVGGGIIGNTLAVALQNSGLRVLSIESQAQSVSITKSRAYVLSMLSGQILRDWASGSEFYH